MFRRFIIAAALSLFAAPAVAQTHLEIGQTHTGVLTAQSETGKEGERSDCYSIDTQPGDRLTVSVALNGWLRVGRGSTCGAVRTWDLEDRGIGLFSVRLSTLSFEASGGTYLISAGHPGTGSYTIAVTRSAGGGGRVLPAGAPIVRPPAGTASTTGDPTSNLAGGEMIKDCDRCPQMTVIPAGSFMMGSPDDEEGRENIEGPRHLVTFRAAFAMGIHEVTFDEYDACVADQACRNVSDEGWGRGRRPVMSASFHDAQRYVAWLSRKTGHNYFLPSEAEWEYAARAGTDTPWNTGVAIIASDANFLDQFSKTVPVGSYPANAFGLHDMHGNVLEWTQDCMDTAYLGAPTDGSAATGDCSNQAILRGGSFLTSPVHTRSAVRFTGPRSLVGAGLGFRVTRAL